MIVLRSSQAGERVLSYEKPPFLAEVSINGSSVTDQTIPLLMDWPKSQQILPRAGNGRERRYAFYLEVFILKP